MGRFLAGFITGAVTVVATAYVSTKLDSLNKEYTEENTEENTEESEHQVDGDKESLTDDDRYKKAKENLGKAMVQQVECTIEEIDKLLEKDKERFKDVLEDVVTKAQNNLKSSKAVDNLNTEGI